MDALELMVDQRHFDQRIEGANLVIIDEALQPTHGGTDLVLILGRNVNNLSRLIVPQCSARRLPKPIGASLQKLEHAAHRRIGDQAAGLQQLVEPEFQGIPVERDSLCRR